MRRFLFGIIIFVVLMAFSLPVQAQSEITIEEMQVKIWPEYDQPSVLVINNIFLSGDVKFPARINFNIPSTAGAPHTVAVRELDGQLYLLDYDMATLGEWTQLTFTSPYAEIWVEYYDSSIDLKTDLRSYEFKWIGAYPVKNLSLEVQQPLTATTMTFKESMGTGQAGPDGLTYFTNHVGEIKANTKITLNLEYTKTDDTLSSSMTIPVQPVNPLSKETIPGKTSFTQILPFIIAGVGLVVLVIGVLWYMGKQKEILPKPRQRHAVSRNTSARQDEGNEIFCHRCGRRADSSDVFCRSCGTKLKLEE